MIGWLFALAFLLLWVTTSALLVRAWRDKWDAEELVARLLAQIEVFRYGVRHD